MLTMEQVKSLVDSMVGSTDPYELTIYDVFGYGSRNGDTSERKIEKLWVAIKAGAVSMEIVLDIPRRATVKSVGQFYGGELHNDLCCCAASWMVERGMRWTPECNYPGGRSDVACLDKLFAVECGGTQSQKVLDAVLSHWSVMVVPYVGWTPAGEIIAFIFRPCDDHEMVVKHCGNDPWASRSKEVLDYAFRNDEEGK